MTTEKSGAWSSTGAGLTEVTRPPFWKFPVWPWRRINVRRSATEHSESIHPGALDP
ncbi:hypothetical protein [Ornithinimicrobium kibberense]|uniref:hypothetical protein n=1 Tax=Ornithinimicrobium kibberense TaxID=282060 RepID=UPI003613766E